MLLLVIGLLISGLLLLLVITTHNLQTHVKDVLAEHSAIVESQHAALALVSRRADTADKQLDALRREREDLIAVLTRFEGLQQNADFLQRLNEHYALALMGESRVANARIMALLDPLAARRVAEAERGEGPFIARGGAPFADGFSEVPVADTPLDPVQSFTPSTPPKSPSPNGSSVAPPPRPHVPAYEEPLDDSPAPGTIE